ncbi:MAG: hemolysin family protein [Cytophagales bacterium]|nr:hemolysin family protein [Cytophagales bacterium]
MIFDALLIIILISFNAFFVIAEFSLVRVRSSIVELKVNEGMRSAKIVQNIHKDMNAYLSATQLGITLSSLALGWIGEEAASEVISMFLNSIGFPPTSDISMAVTIPVAFFFITFIHIILGEQLPKTFGIQFSEKVSFAVAFPLQLFYNIFRPLIWILNIASSLLIRTLGGKPLNIHEEHSAEELKMLLAKGKESGVIQKDEHEMIENVFTFNEMTVKQVMIPRTKLVAVEASAPDEQILELIEVEGFSRMPVYKNTIDDIVGIISAKDVLKMASKGETIILSNYLRPAYFIPQTKKISALLKDFQKRRLHMAVVIDEFGGTAGIVTIEDVIEELVGDIHDEDDEVEKPKIERETDTDYIVNGVTTIAEVNEVLRYPLPDSDEYETISGMMNHIFGKMPEEKEEKEFGGYSFTILKVNNKVVESVRLHELLKKDD